MAATTDTSQRILDIAERLVQTRGFNGFSYADIAEAMKVTKASLHYHFPSKADLGERLIARYEANFLAALEKIDAQTDDPRQRLRRYAALYADVLSDQRMCLCGMLAAEYGTLPKAMQENLRHYFGVNEKWLADVLKQGKKIKVLKFPGSASEAAQAIVGTLEGAMMIARTYGEMGRFKAASERMLAELTA